MNDNETKQILSTADHVISMTNSDGWKYVYSKLQERIADLQNINNLDLLKPDTITTQLLSRKMAVDEIYAWLKLDVFGFVEQQKNNTAKLTENSESYIETQ